MLSYPSSLCIFEHLDVNRRLQLAAKCPSLRTAHRIAPMKIEDLEIQESSITINNCVQEFEAISPTEIQYTYTRMGCDWKSSVQTLHTQATVTQIIKSLVANFFGKNAKIHVKNLKTTSGLLEAFGPILKLSTPLEKLRTSVKGPWDSIFSNPILRSARWLVLDDLTETIDWADTLKPLENPRIQMEGSQIDQDVLHRMVWDWLEKPRPIGYRFTTPISVRVIMRSFYVEFGAFWKDIPTEYNGNTYCLVIHTTDTYELVVYSQRNPNLVFDPRLSDDESKLALFTLEVVPLGKTLPCSTRFA
ncbi:Protein CBG24958 [Caenorhabditis briggsae]|nr:Protein CBG24958 [Caenorhabditis briggsae]CAP21444.2 Protein CBG24958 [Caenorhabditis briggsae]